jgi:malonate-semialdehyde dehydrogenase (acetylating)/methylmalonate-semialdehyde dehydrogenase
MTTTTAGSKDQATRKLANFIGGEWVQSTVDSTIDVINPAKNDPLAKLPESSVDEVEAAVAAARAAFPGWKKTSVLARARTLFRLREIVAARAEEFAELLTLDTGKSLVDARLEMVRTLETIECATAIPQTMQGMTLGQIAGGIDAETFRQPVGVCAAITPFNFPAMLSMWFLPFAIGCGNTFVMKPSEQTPLVPELFFKVLAELELPPGVVNLVHGGKTAVNTILDSPGVDAVSFVGSAETAQYIYEKSAAAGKRVQAFGGAKNFMVVMPDAVVDSTANNIVASAFGGAGQRCMAGAVIVSVGGSWSRLREPLLEYAKKMKVGDGADPDVDLGPLVSFDAQERVGQLVQSGVDEGATLVLDGRVGPDSDGAFLGPTILEGVTEDMVIGRDEIFGPVLTVIEVDTFDDALALINRSRYGNGTSIFTESGAAARRYREEVEVGMVGVNIGVAAPVSFFPFGGWKASFLGDVGACGRDAVDFYTRKKTITSRWFSGGPTEKYFVEN